MAECGSALSGPGSREAPTRAACADVMGAGQPIAAQALLEDGAGRRGSRRRCGTRWTAWDAAVSVQRVRAEDGLAVVGSLA